MVNWEILVKLIEDRNGLEKIVLSIRQLEKRVDKLIQENAELKEKLAAYECPDQENIR